MKYYPKSCSANSKLPAWFEAGKIYFYKKADVENIIKNLYGNSTYFRPSFNSPYCLYIGWYEKDHAKWGNHIKCYIITPEGCK